MGSQLFNLQKTMQPAAATGLQSGIQTGMPTMTDFEFNELRDFIYKISGIYFTESKKYLLEGRIYKRLSANYIKSYSEYLKFVKSADGKPEINYLLDIVTINETFFFRAEQQYEAFEKEVVRSIIESRPSSGSQLFNIWSAASSTGEEPYSLAMLIAEKIKPQYPHVTFRIVGSDINRAVLETARKGLYKDYSVKSMPQYYLNKYFTKVDGMYQISDEIRRMVRFLPVNLNDWNAVKMMNFSDVIFCANVLIYFDLASKERVVSYLYDALNKGGFLFIGSSESLHGVSKAFRLMTFHKTTVYKKD